jgi:hypothetical protein
MSRGEVRTSNVREHLLGTHLEGERALSVPKRETEFGFGEVDQDAGLHDITVGRGIEELEIEGIYINSIEDRRGAVRKLERKTAPIGIQSLEFSWDREEQPNAIKLQEVEPILDKFT